MRREIKVLLVYGSIVSAIAVGIAMLMTYLFGPLVALSVTLFMIGMWTFIGVEYDFELQIMRFYLIEDFRYKRYLKSEQFVFDKLADQIKDKSEFSRII